jgi:uncharacterized membrane-anchored protein YitT (DUF2179 family)
VGKTLAQFLYHFLPDLENFNFKTEIVQHLDIPSDIYLYSILYGIFYTLFVLIIAVLIFRKRDFI